MRQNCLPDYSNQSHLLQLALEFPPLMGVMIAIAAMDLGTPHYDQLAMESYLFSLRSLQDRLALSQDAGSEDGLLGTAVCLCVFEVCSSNIIYKLIEDSSFLRTCARMPHQISVYMPRLLEYCSLYVLPVKHGAAQKQLSFLKEYAQSRFYTTAR